MRRKPVTGFVRLTMTINGTVYTPTPLMPHPACAKMAWRLTKEDGTTYDIHLNEFGAECTCPDFLYVRNHKDPKGCKHIAAFRAAGLLP